MMTTPEERAAALAAKWTTSARYQVNDAPEKRIKLIPREIEADIAAALREAAAQARREAMEEAAVIASCNYFDSWKAAALIRALGAKP